MSVRDELERYVAEILLGKGHAPETIPIATEQILGSDLTWLSSDVTAGIRPIEQARKYLFARINAYMAGVPYYYRLLALGQYASQDDIKNAYRKLIQIYHPDISKDPAATEKLKEINAAYAVLSDPAKRARYDEFELRYTEPKEGRVPRREPGAPRPAEYEDPFVIALRRSDQTTGVRMLLARYWREIIESGIDDFFVSHPEFGVPFPTKDLINAFMQIIGLQLRSDMATLSEVPFELTVLAGAEGDRILMRNLIIAGTNSDQLRSALAMQYELRYRELAREYGAQYDTASQFVDRFCSWLISYQPFKSRGHAAE